MRGDNVRGFIISVGDGVLDVPRRVYEAIMSRNLSPSVGGGVLDVPRRAGEVIMSEDLFHYPYGTLSPIHFPIFFATGMPTFRNFDVFYMNKNKRWQYD